MRSQRTDLLRPAPLKCMLRLPTSRRIGGPPAPTLRTRIARNTWSYPTNDTSARSALQGLSNARIATSQLQLSATRFCGAKSATRTVRKALAAPSQAVMLSKLGLCGLGAFPLPLPPPHSYASYYNYPHSQPHFWVFSEDHLFSQSLSYNVNCQYLRIAGRVQST